ncbi:MAG: transcription-repair coupling factor [Thermoanaerobaculia bacterium]|nr:transcription-repair coupling factor [Thermoanaerobaculia bacterium]
MWSEFRGALRSSAPYLRLRQELGDVSRLPVSAASWVCNLVAEDLGRPLVVIVRHEADALIWREVERLMTGEDSCIVLPTPALTPYQHGTASIQARAQTVLALEQLVHGPANPTLLATPRALFEWMPRPESFSRRVRRLAAGDEAPPDELAQFLVTNGYDRVDLVHEVGEFSVRGGVIDLFPPGRDSPVRIDLFGDTVESLRAFDPMSQRSAGSVEVLRVLPLTPFLADESERRGLGASLLTRFGGGLDREELERVRALARGELVVGYESLDALLQEEVIGVVDLLPGALVVTIDPPTLAEEAEHYARRLEDDCAAQRAHGVLALPPGELLRPYQEVVDILEAAEVRIGGLPGREAIDFSTVETEKLDGQLPRLPREVSAAMARGERFVLACESEQRETIESLLESQELTVGAGGVELAEGKLSRGFRLPAAGLVLFGAGQLFPPRASGPRRRTRYGPFVSSLRDLEVGDFVVHADHGIGQFTGLRTVGEESSQEPLPETLRAADDESRVAVEVMELTYSGGRTLLLPLSRIDQVQKYGGIEGMAPQLDQLGGASWNKTKSRVRKGMRKLAIDLLALYAERQLAKAPPMGADSDLQRQFFAAFAFDETEDQLDSIAAISADLEREMPMDRLLCGDVGFGKTEVAMRAAFKVVDHGHQVAVLAPTTILADQHLETFRRRFAGFPINIEMISRFRSQAEIKDIQKRVAAGKIDILIGTHRILSKDVVFPRLALLIVDEEQRFGVGQKEKLKNLKKDLHVLAMSATPVPRTLQLSLAGVRDLSVIETPPRDRMAVETTILPFTPELIREAIEFELEREGQVYYVYNRVEDIDHMASYLSELVPGLRVTVGHGQMDEHELARRMHAFTAGEYDVLLATTIIENGIHIPRVNTMLVHHADRFGLAQLYQLRGRVGRSSQRGYCYLLVPADRVLSQTARKRLDALRDFSELGAGFRIAARDLEIRGAGNLLGAEQSGHIVAVGIETYMKMLEDCLKELRGEALEEGPSTTLDLPVAMSIPPDYITDPNVRLEVYRKLAVARDSAEDLLAEMRDRFGVPPSEVEQLVAVSRLKRQAESLRVQSVSWQRGELVFRFRQNARIDPDRLIELMTEGGARFSPDGILAIRPESGEGMLEVARSILERLAS